MSTDDAQKMLNEVLSLYSEADGEEQAGCLGPAQRLRDTASTLEAELVNAGFDWSKDGVIK